MSSRAFLTLVGIVFVLGAVALFLAVPERRETPATELLIPALEAAINDVDRLTVTAGGNRKVATLVRGQNRWTVAEAADYPADLGKIRQTLIALARARIVETKTANPGFYDRLGVEDIQGEDAGGLLLEIKGPDIAASVIIGQTGVGGGDRAYARPTGEATSLMVSADLDVSGDMVDWLDRSLLDISSGRVHAVTLAHPSGEVLRIEKSTRDTTDFQVLNIPEGRELSYGTVANSIGAVLSSLKLDDVTASKDFQRGDVEPVTGRFETFDGLVIETQTFRLEDGARVTFSVSADEALAARFRAEAPPVAEEPPIEDADTPAEAPEDPETPEDAEAESQSDAEADFAATVAEAATLNERLAGWVYTLPSYKSDQLTKRLEDLLAAEEEE